jgi:type VI secretion system protein ImpJ
LVNLQLPGIALRSLPVAPRQLPYHAGSHYFELDRQGELWKQLERSGSLALFVTGDFPGLELELWAVRQP